MLGNNNTITSKIMFFLLGGGIGAGLALLFAPKSGRELRQDIADAAAKGYDETLATAACVKERSLEYVGTLKEKGGEVLGVVAESASAIRDELSEDAEKVGDIVGEATKRLSQTVRPRQIM